MNPYVSRSEGESKGRFKIEFFLLIVFSFLLAVLLLLFIVLIATVSLADTTPPTIAIISPQNTTYKSSSVPLVFTVSKPASWIGYGLDRQANVTISANTTLTGLLNGCHSVVVYGNDTSGNLGYSETVYFTVAVNRPPTAPVVDVTPNIAYTVDDLVCTVTEASSDPDGDLATYRYEWFRDGELQQTTNTTESKDVLSSTLTSKGEVWKCIVTPNDGTEDGPADEDSVIILNSPPRASNVKITPSKPSTNHNLTGNYTCSDVDNDEELGTEIRWYKNEILQIAYNDQLTIPSETTSGGEEWYFTVKPKDGTDFGNLAKSDVVTIQKPTTYTLRVYSSPTGVTFTVDSDSHTTPWFGTYNKGTSVSGEMPSTHMVGEAKYFWSNWSDGETSRSRTVTLNRNISLTGQFSGPYYELTVDSLPIRGITFTIDGVNKATLYTEWLVEGSYTLVMPETYDGYVWSYWLEDGDPDRSKTIVLPGTTWTGVYTRDIVPPSIDIISPRNTTYAASSVPLTFLVNESTSWIGYSLGGEANITIAGNTTLTGLSDGCHNVVVYANDTLGNMGGSGKVYFTIAVNRPPTAPVVGVTPKVAYTVDDLVCSVTRESSDPDGDLVTYRYDWFRDGVLQQTTVTTELTNILSSNMTAKGDVWKCMVIPNDGQIDGPSDEDEVAIRNSPPEAGSLTMLPATPDTTDCLDASYSYVDVDGDSEFGSEIRWYKDGILQSGYNDLKTVPPSATCKGEEWYFTVRPKDGVDFGDLETSSPVTIQNVPPTKPLVRISPDSPKTTDDLICDITIPSADPDGDAVTYTFEWYKDDVRQLGLTTNKVSKLLTVKIEVWRCKVTPNDGIVDGPSDEDFVSIVNSPPTRPVVDVTPDSPERTDELTCTIVTHSHDPDGDVITYRYDWYKNWVWQSTGETVPPWLTSKGETWKCVVTPNDGTEDGAPGEDLVTISYETSVYVDPQGSVVKAGQAFTVNVSIADVSGLQGFDFCLSYNTTILDCLEVEEGGFIAGFGPTFVVKLEIEDQFNETQGRVWMAVVILGNASASGRGTLATITFNATAPGEGALDLHSIQPYAPDAVKLCTCGPKAISNKAVDGYVEVSSNPESSDSPTQPSRGLNEDWIINMVEVSVVTGVYFPSWDDAGFLRVLKPPPVGGVSVPVKRDISKCLSVPPRTHACAH